MELSDETKAIVASNLINATVTLHATHRKRGATKDFDQYIPKVLEHYFSTLEKL
jgi:hypothetical protein